MNNKIFNKGFVVGSILTICTLLGLYSLPAPRAYTRPHIVEIEYDGCQYIYDSSTSTGEVPLTHKGNCRNHLNGSLR